jgi:hypothetical protein
MYLWNWIFRPTHIPCWAALIKISSRRKKLPQLWVPTFLRPFGVHWRGHSKHPLWSGEKIKLALRLLRLALELFFENWGRRSGVSGRGRARWPPSFFLWRKTWGWLEIQNELDRFESIPQTQIRSSNHPFYPKRFSGARKTSRNTENKSEE